MFRSRSDSLARRFHLTRLVQTKLDTMSELLKESKARENSFLLYSHALSLDVVCDIGKSFVAAIDASGSDLTAMEDLVTKYTSLCELIIESINDYLSDTEQEIDQILISKISEMVENSLYYLNEVGINLGEDARIKKVRVFE